MAMFWLVIKEKKNKLVNFGIILFLWAQAFRYLKLVAFSFQSLECLWSADQVC